MTPGTRNFTTLTTTVSHSDTNYRCGRRAWMVGLFWITEDCVYA